MDDLALYGLAAIAAFGIIVAIGVVLVDEIASWRR